jgi:hypothetical protein
VHASHARALTKDPCAAVRLTSFRPSAWQTADDSTAADDGTDTAPAAAATRAGGGPAAGAPSREVEVVELYRPTSTFAPLFEALGHACVPVVPAPHR